MGEFVVSPPCTSITNYFPHKNNNMMDVSQARRSKTQYSNLSWSMWMKTTNQQTKII